MNDGAATTLPDDTEPSAEALEAAIDILWPLYTDDKMPKMEFARKSRECRRIALALDRFRAAGVREERKRIAAYIRGCGMGANGAMIAAAILEPPNDR